MYLRLGGCNGGNGEGWPRLLCAPVTGEPASAADIGGSEYSTTDAEHETTYSLLVAEHETVHVVLDQVALRTHPIAALQTEQTMFF
jgi:hypothetical protein